MVKVSKQTNRRVRKKKRTSIVDLIEDVSLGDNGITVDLDAGTNGQDGMNYFIATVRNTNRRICESIYFTPEIALHRRRVKDPLTGDTKYQDLI